MLVRCKVKHLLLMKWISTTFLGSPFGNIYQKSSKYVLWLHDNYIIIKPEKCIMFKNLSYENKLDNCVKLYMFVRERTYI